jgi:hypothetical protein
VVPTLEQAVEAAWEAARPVAADLIRAARHEGRRLRVPGDFDAVQAAIDHARAGDSVVVGPGTWRGLLTMKDGVKLVSDAADGGDDLVAVEGAQLRLPRRALRTILDGTGTPPGPHGIIDFLPGSGRGTVVDGFTITNLPRQNHHQPGHAHALNLRGASPIVTNCLVCDNGSTGIGSHVVYRDQAQPLETRDFRWANVEHRAEAVLYGNVVCRNLGRGIGCNHFAAPWILGNEVFDNDDAELGEPAGPGIGAKHGARPVLVGNVVHGNPGGGISCKVGIPQGAHPIDRPACPTFRANVVFENGTERPGLSCRGGGTQASPILFAENVVLREGRTGIGVSGDAWAVLENNVVASGRGLGIALRDCEILRLEGNRVAACAGAGFLLGPGAKVREMTGNASERNGGPPYVVAGGTVAPPPVPAPPPDEPGSDR